MKISINSKNMFRGKVMSFIIGRQIPYSMAKAGKMFKYFK